MGSFSQDFAASRAAMVERQLRRRGISDAVILDAFRTVPREAFVGPGQVSQAYGDHPLPIEAGQTISQPFIVATMIEAAAIGKQDKVLEVGAGSGYAAAVMSRLAREVIAIERQSELVDIASRRLRELGYDNVRIVEGDGTRGWPEEAPFNAILAAATGSHVPRALLDQLADAGRVVMPVGDPRNIQELVKLTRARDGTLEQSDLGPVRFVPLIGEEGWSDARA